MVSVTRLDIDAPPSVDEDDLTPAETGVLNLLAEGRCTPAFVASRIPPTAEAVGFLLAIVRSVRIRPESY